MEQKTLYDITDDLKISKKKGNKSGEKIITARKYSSSILNEKNTKKTSFSILSNHSERSEESFDVSESSSEINKKNSNNNKYIFSKENSFSKFYLTNKIENMSEEKKEVISTEVEEDFRKFSKHFKKSFILFFFITGKMLKNLISNFLLWLIFIFSHFINKKTTVTKSVKSERSEKSELIEKKCEKKHSSCESIKNDCDGITDFSLKKQL
jgi:hypothetical protein